MRRSGRGRPSGQRQQRPDRQPGREKPLKGAALRAEIAKWDRVLAARPGDFIARSLRALHLGTANRWPEALRDSERAVAQVPHGHPAELELIALRAMARGEAGRLEEALSDLDLVVKLKCNALLLAARGEVRRRLGDLAGARSDQDRSIELSTTDPFAFVCRGRVRLEEGDTEGAILDFNAAIELDPEGIAPYHHRARARQGQGDLPGAQADWESALRRAREALARDHDDTKARTWIAWIYADALGTNLDEALGLMEQIRERARDFDERADFLEALGRVHYRLGHLDEALRLYEKAHALCPADADMKRRLEEVRGAANS